jgi:hypothetical protein
VESEIDKGTTFHVQLPLGKSHLPTDQISAARNSPQRLSAQTLLWRRPYAGKQENTSRAHRNRWSQHPTPRLPKTQSQPIRLHRSHVTKCWWWMTTPTCVTTCRVC